MVLAEEEIPERLRQKMRKWGILRKEKHSILLPFLQVAKELGIDEEVDHSFPNYNTLVESLLLSTMLHKREIDISREVLDLKKRVQELEIRVGKRRTPTKANQVYELFKEELEKEHFGEIVAIDTELKQIVGIGDTLLEAYNNAKKRTGKDQFDFQRVGYKYIHKVR